MAARSCARVIRGTRNWLSLSASGKPGEVRAVAEVVRPHREHDVDRDVVLLRGVDEQIHARGGLRPAQSALAMRPKRKISSNWSATISRLSPIDRLGVDRRATAPVRGCCVEERADASRILVGQPRPPGRRRVTSARVRLRDRIAAGPEDRNVPRRSGGRQIATVERRQQARAHQRRFAAARHADDRDQPPPARGASADRRIARRARRTTRIRAARTAAVPETDCPAGHERAPTPTVPAAVMRVGRDARRIARASRRSGRSSRTA